MEAITTGALGGIMGIILGIAASYAATLASMTVSISFTAIVFTVSGFQHLHINVSVKRFISAMGERVCCDTNKAMTTTFQATLEI